MVVFDTNAILRYILQDNKEMAESVETELSLKSCFVPVEVIAEMVYVLSKVYRVPRAEISVTIKGIISIPNISTPDNSVISKALDTYSGTGLDFVDCLMVGYAKVRGYEVFTFDKELKKHISSYLA